MNPCRFDTENFVFTCHIKFEEKSLTIKRKNTDVSSRVEDYPYCMFYEKDGFDKQPACVDIIPLFSPETSAEIHIHKVGQFFTPWFKVTHDCRQELEYGIKRFYALESYEMLDKGPDQFAHALKGHRKTYEDIIANVSKLYDEKVSLSQRLKLNFQDKGVSTARGSTIFDTIARTWVMYETKKQHPDKPEYLWSVQQLGTTFQPEITIVESFSPEADSNQDCFEFIMQEQKKLYGVCAIDLDRVDFNIRRIQGILAQLELILDIPFRHTAIITPEE